MPEFFVGLENYEWLWDDSVFWLSVFNTLLYTGVASAFKFAVGLYLALLLNQHMPFKAIIRALVLDSLHRADGALRHRVLVDLRQSVLDCLMVAQEARTDRDQHRFSWRHLERAMVSDFRQHLARCPFIAITLLAGLQTVSPSLYEAATIDGASRWQMFRYVTYPLLTPIIAVVMTFSVLFTFTDFQLIWVLTRGGPANATHLMATLGYQRAIGGGYLGKAPPSPPR